MYTSQLVGDYATHSLARLKRHLTLSLLLAGNSPASLSRGFSHLFRRTVERVQLRFLGLCA